MRRFGRTVLIGLEKMPPLRFGSVSLVFFRAVRPCFLHHHCHADTGSSGFHFALVSGHLAELAKSLEQAAHRARRCITVATEKHLDVNTKTFA